MAIADFAMLVDQSRCVNCEACTLVCKQIYGTSKGIFKTKINVHESGSYPDVVMVYNKKACMHCSEARCVIACPTKACHKTGEGLTVIDERMCIYCNYCAGNCPYGAITFDRGKNIMEKCSMCNTRVEKGLKPFCAEVCTSKVISFGARAAMIAEGQKRVEALKAQGYEDAVLYGESELGGLRVLLVLQHAPEKYKLPEDPQVPVGNRIWKYIISPLGGIAAVAAAVGLIANYAGNKRNVSKQ